MNNDSIRDDGDVRTSTGLILRPEREDDLEFLYRLYASTRAVEMTLVNWKEEDQEAFLRMQFLAQRSYYREHYSEARFDVIERDGTAVGRLYVSRWPDDIRVVDIALMPEHRGQGLGGGLMRTLLDEAEASGKTVSIHVEPYNPALHLYERLGFQAKGDDNGVYRLMEWRSGTPSTAAPPCDSDTK